MGWISTAVAIIALIRELIKLLADLGWDITDGISFLTEGVKQARECNDVECFVNQVKKLK